MTVVIIVIVVIVVFVGVGAFVAARLSRTRRLRGRFGPEYERSLQEADSRGDAEAELLEREQRHEELEIRPLDPASRERYGAQWLAIQERFVDAPARSVHDADLLVTELMNERGYPTEEGFGQRLADLSVEHAGTLDHYRAAHEISARVGTDEAETEEMRRALVHYRALFADLLDGDTAGEPGRSTPGTTRAGGGPGTPGTTPAAGGPSTPGTTPAGGGPSTPGAAPIGDRPSTRGPSTPGTNPAAGGPTTPGTTPTGGRPSTPGTSPAGGDER